MWNKIDAKFLKEKGYKILLIKWRILGTRGFLYPFFFPLTETVGDVLGKLVTHGKNNVDFGID